MRDDLTHDLIQLTGEHLVLVLSAMIVALLIGVPLGILLSRRVGLRKWLLGFASVMQTIPSLALFGFLIPIPFIGGIGTRTVIVSLVLYALLPILRNTFVGISAIDPAISESAIAMGMTQSQLLRQVQLPLAAPTILAGIRVATVTTIGTATIAAAIGGGGLGVFIFRGVASVDTIQILAGAVPAALMALLADGGLGWIEKKNIAGLIALLVFLGISSVGCSSSKNAHMLKIGSKNFTEQVVLGEIIAQHLEHRLQQKVDRRFNLGGTMVAHQAMLSGGIDLYPEYSGTALAAVLKQPFDASHAMDSAAVLAQVRAEYERQFHLAWLDPLGINNGFVMVIRGPEARANHIETLSDAAKSSAGWTLGVGYEFDQRADGMGALKSYPLKWNSGTKTMDLGLLYRALAQKQVSMIAANATDGLLSKMDLKPLEDDKHVFPPYELSIVARDESLRDWAGLQAALLELSGKFSNRKMQELNFHVDAEHRPVARVAADFLHEAGLQ